VLYKPQQPKLHRIDQTSVGMFQERRVKRPKATQ
jgi:hypothetical protein